MKLSKEKFSLLNNVHTDLLYLLAIQISRYKEMCKHYSKQIKQERCADIIELRNRARALHVILFGKKCIAIAAPKIPNTKKIILCQPIENCMDL